MTSYLSSIFFKGAFFPLSKLNAFIRAFFWRSRINLLTSPYPIPATAREAYTIGTVVGTGTKGRGPFFGKKEFVGLTNLIEINELFHHEGKAKGEQDVPH